MSAIALRMFIKCSTEITFQGLKRVGALSTVKIKKEKNNLPAFLITSYLENIIHKFYFCVFFFL